MKKNSFLSNFLKSYIIGIGILFPIAASYLAVVLGMYEKILDVINNFFKNLKTNFSFVLALVLGIGASVLTSALLIKFTYEKYPIATLLFFVGLIVGGIPIISKKCQKQYKPINLIILIACLGLFTCLSLINPGNVQIIPKKLGILKIIAAGALAAGTMIIPGVSGSAILISIGYYKPMLDVIHDALKFSSSFANDLFIIILFGIGMIIGLLIVGKIMDILLKKHNVKTHFGIIGIILASVVNIIIQIFSYNSNIIEIVIGIVLFIIGFIISYKFIKEE